MAVVEAVKEASWLTGLVNELGVQQGGVQSHCASQSVIDVRFHKIRELIASGEILLQNIGTVENAADMLTKPVTTDKFKHCLDLLNVYSC